MAMLTTHNDTTTLTTSTMKLPLKRLHNEWSHLGHLQHPDEAAKEILDFIQGLSAHGVCYALTAKKPMHDWFYFATLPPMETCEKAKANKKRQKTLEHRVIVEQLLGEVVLILF